MDRGHTDLNHGPIGLQPIALPLSYIPTGHNAPVLFGGGGEGQSLHNRLQIWSSAGKLASVV